MNSVISASDSKRLRMIMWLIVYYVTIICIMLSNIRQNSISPYALLVAQMVNDIEDIATFKFELL